MTYQQTATYVTPLHPTLNVFFSITKKYLALHAAILFAACTEALLLVLFFSSLVDTFVLGIAIAVLFFTGLLYFILRLYTNDQKPEEFQKLVDATLYAEKRGPLITAHLAKEMAEKIEQERAPSYPFIEKLSGRFSFIQDILSRLHRKDVLQVKEMFLTKALQELRSFIALEPLSSRGHTLLGKNFLDFAELAKQKQDFQAYKRAIQIAIEEFTIVDACQPGNAETHRELAFCFRALKKTVQEIEQFEKIVDLEPYDHSALFTLGVLYFRTGEKAKGLQVYDKLRNALPEKAAELMQYY